MAAEKVEKRAVRRAKSKAGDSVRVCAVVPSGQSIEWGEGQG